jgi:hypothetical protein
MRPLLWAVCYGAQFWRAQQAVALDGGQCPAVRSTAAETEHGPCHGRPQWQMDATRREGLLIAGDTEDIPPWEAVGLPGGIQESDLEDAAFFLRYRQLPASSRLISAYGPSGTGHYNRLYGTQYEHNIKRMEALRDLPAVPNGWDRQGRHIVLTYPALLLPDPSPLEPGITARPVAVCSRTGYVGSAWEEPATALRPHVDDACIQGAYLVTALRVIEDTVGTIPLCWTLSVWLPDPSTRAQPIADLSGQVPEGVTAATSWPKDG